MNSPIAISDPTRTAPGAGRHTWLPLGAFVLVTLAGAGCGDKPASKPPTPAAAAATPRPTAAGPALFEERAAPAGLNFVQQMGGGTLCNIMISDGAGGTFLDFDNDGFLDVYLVNAGPTPVLSDAPPNTARLPNRLYRNQGDGTFEDVTDKAGVAGTGFATTAAAADLDNDGHTDLLVVNFGGLILYRNQGNGTFQDVTVKAGLTSKQAGISATFLDYDGDGFLDLLLANYLVYDPAVKLPPGAQIPYPGPLSYPPELNILYRNRGDGTFEEVSERAGVRVPGHRAMSVSVLDYNLDGYEDLYVSNDATPNLLLANDGQGRFQEVGLTRGVAMNQFGEPGGSMGAAVGDVNGDGRPDLLVTRFEKPSLYVNSAQGFFEDRVAASGILSVTAQHVTWGTAFLDFDNDGDLDALIATGDPHSLQGSPTLLLENRGDGTFANAGPKGGPFFDQMLNLRGCGVFDLDNDGRLDALLTALKGRAFLLRNRHAAPGHWLTLQLAGTRGNRDGFGAQVQVTAGGRVYRQECRCPTGYLFQSDPRLHFGLGQAQQVDRVEIRWPKPGGQTQILTNVPADRVLRIQEPR